MIPFDGEFIEKVVIGKRYDNPNDEPKTIWCYVEVLTGSALAPTLYLLHIHNGLRVDTEITKSIAKELGVPIRELTRAKRRCSI